MKNLFIQIKQWVLKHRKKLIYGALALFIFQIWFLSLGGINNQVFAEEWSTPTTDSNFHTKATKWITECSFFKIVIYVVIYPILVIAWKLVDNSLVYAEVFNFDAVLWKLWTIVRNLANYSLWFVFVYKVFESLLSSKWWGNIKKILVPTLIAWIWIQASWFVMAVLIDISTILTYSVGGLPITILWNNITEEQNSAKNNPYVYQTLIYFDGENPDEFDLFFSNTQSGSTEGEKFYISKCRLFTYSHTESKETLILWPKYIYYKTNDDSWTTRYFPTESNLCHNDSRVYQFSSLYVTWVTNEQDVTSWAVWSAKQLEYDKYVDNAIRNLTTSQDITVETVRGFIQAWNILQIWDAHEPWWITWAVFKGIHYDNPGFWQDVNNQHIWSGKNMMKLNDVLNIDGWSYVSVFNTLYSSLLHAWEDLRVSGSVTDSTYVRLLNEMLGIWHALAIAIPLIWMAIVFMMRIGILWVAIAMSPFIVLLTAFGWNDKVLKDKTLKYFNPKNLIPIIFSPAIVCFAISLSTVLVRIIMALNWQKIMTNDVSILWWLVTLDIAGLWVNLWKMLCAVMWIAITWFLVRAAVQSSELWKSSMVTGVKDLAQNMLWSMPLVPVPTKDGNVEFIWANAAFGLNGQQWIIESINNKIKTTYANKDQETVNDVIDPSNAEKRLADAYKKVISTHTFTSPDWTTEEVTITGEGGTKKVTFMQLPGDKQEEIIQAINAMDESKRVQIGNKKKEFTINNWETDVVYEFKDKKYVKKS